MSSSTNIHDFLIQIIVLIVFAGLLAGGAYGLSQLKQDFDPDWFLPPDSMTIKFKAADEKVRPLFNYFQ